MTKEMEEAIVSLNLEKIEDMSKAANMHIPEDYDTFLAGIHKARLYISSTTDEQREESKQWLINKGFMPAIVIEQ